MGEYKMELIKVVGYTVFMYFYLIFIIRVMGKREVGSLSIFDLAVYFTISDLITMSIVDHQISIFHCIVSVAILCVLQKLIAVLTLKNKKIRDFIDGKKSLIVDNGKIDFKEMKKQKYTIDDLYSQIRSVGIDSITKVKWAVLENSGKLSVITYDNSISNFPDPLISDGTLIYENISKAMLSEDYIINKMKECNLNDLKNIRLCLYVDNKLIFIFKKRKWFVYNYCFVY